MGKARALSACFLAAACAWLPAAHAARAQVTDEQIDAAVSRGVAYLYSQQRPDGTFPVYKTHTGEPFPGGSDVMAVAALAYAGEPLTKPQMAKSVKALMEMDLRHTYTVGFRIIALAELYRRSKPEDRAWLRAAIRRDALALADMQLPNGAWSYGKRSDSEAWDFSNTQIGVLGLEQAQGCGVEVNPAVFLKAQNHYLKMVQKDGGWNYNDIGPNVRIGSYGSMTAAAVANLILTREALSPGMGCPCQGDRSAGRRNAQLDQAIERGSQWLADNFSASEIPKKTAGIGTTPYWYYAVQRVAIATGYKYLGRHNWYPAIAANVLRQQLADGSFPRSIPDTAFCLLFLIKGRGPLLMNKLMFQGPVSYTHLTLPTIYSV